ncbi:MAG: Crp/Fnr family transcriptional regulator [Rhodospirillales bacterium]|nr:Crp/Fnr family transcriptional regulator [Rhodospirillales bacterium]
MEERRPKELGVSFRLRRLAAGEVLFRQGDPVFAVFQVASGRVRLVRHLIESRPVVLQNAGPGELFAEAALFADRYHCEAVAAVASEVRALRRRSLLDAFRTDPEAAIRFMAELARQTWALRDHVALLNIRSAEERVLHYLALHAEPDGRIVRLRGTLVELAAEIGLTHETLYRSVRKLERAGRLERVHGGTFRILATT